jgi:hypothetical protein
MNINLLAQILAMLSQGSLRQILARLSHPLSHRFTLIFQAAQRLSLDLSLGSLGQSQLPHTSSILWIVRRFGAYFFSLRLWCVPFYQETSTVRATASHAFHQENHLRVFGSSTWTLILESRWQLHCPVSTA